ncbi:MAG: patatin-like phospholipase family protein [Campylobacterales bacterium]|nr:patatin-like phospholipase family protein [Campylobacterales bacterium]
MKIINLFLLSLILLFTGCAENQKEIAAPKPMHKKPKIAIAFGGGGAKGFAHIGVIKVLEQNGIKPNIITGTSAGAVIGTLYATGMGSIELQQKAMDIESDRLMDFTLSTDGFIKGAALQNFINRSVQNKPIQNLKIPLGIVATNKNTGATAVFTSGNTGQAVRASASVPNVFQAVKIGSNFYIDGGLTQPVPVSAAKRMGADIVIAIDISAKPKSGVSGLLETLDQSINIMNLSALNSELKKANIVIKPNLERLSSVSFDSRHQAILEGEKAALGMLPAIKKAIANYR